MLAFNSYWHLWTSFGLQTTIRHRCRPELNQTPPPIHQGVTLWIWMKQIEFSLMSWQCSHSFDLYRILSHSFSHHLSDGWSTNSDCVPWLRCERIERNIVSIWWQCFDQPNPPTLIRGSKHSESGWRHIRTTVNTKNLQFWDIYMHLVYPMQTLPSTNPERTSAPIASHSLRFKRRNLNWNSSHGMVITVNGLNSDDSWLCEYAFTGSIFEKRTLPSVVYVPKMLLFHCIWCRSLESWVYSQPRSILWAMPKSRWIDGIEFIRNRRNCCAARYLLKQYSIRISILCSFLFPWCTSGSPAMYLISPTRTIPLKHLQNLHRAEKFRSSLLSLISLLSMQIYSISDLATVDKSMSTHPLVIHSSLILQKSSSSHF